MGANQSGRIEKTCYGDEGEYVFCTYVHMMRKYAYVLYSDDYYSVENVLAPRNE